MYKIWLLRNYSVPEERLTYGIFKPFVLYILSVLYFNVKGSFQ